MLASIVIFLGNIAYIINDDSFNLALISPLVIINIISFFLLFGRIFWGDTNFSLMSGELGLNTIFHSKNFFLRNKRFIDSIILTIQGAGFLFLAFYTQDPFAFFGTFIIVLNINILWLLFQIYCFYVYKKCIKQKFELSLNGYNKEEFLKKDNRADKLIYIVITWLINNVFFNLLAILVYFIYPYDETIAIYAGLIFTVLNSLTDFVLTGHFYSQPETFLFGRRINKVRPATTPLDIDKFHDFIANDKIKPALEYLNNYFTQIGDIDSINFILLKKSNYTELTKHKSKGIISYEQYTLEKSKLITSITGFISEVV